MPLNGNGKLINPNYGITTMTSYHGVYLTHLALVKNNFPERFGEAQTIYRKLSSNLLDKYFFKILNQLGINEFYECGAHEANASILFSKTGKSIAIEANPITYNEKTIEAQKYGVKTYNLALGMKKGKVKILIQNRNSKSGSTSVLKKVRTEQVEHRIIDSTTIDNICALNSTKNSTIAFWIDVEGFAYEVLKGGSKILKGKNVKVIKVELEEKPIWRNQKLSKDVNDLLSSYGFLPIYFDLERENQHNCIYIRSENVPDIENLISGYFRELSELKLSKFDYYFYSAKDFLHSKKNMTKNHSLIFHLIFLLLGSKSSFKHLKEKLLKK